MKQKKSRAIVLVTSWKLTTMTITEQLKNMQNSKNKGNDD